MSNSRIHRPSPALVVAMLALIVALGGTGYAAGLIPGSKIKNHSIAGKKLKKNTLTGKQINESKLAKVPAAALADKATSATSAGKATSADSAANATKLGGVAAAGYQKKLMWAVVRDDGSILNQSGGLTVNHPAQGEYYIDFGVDVGHAALFVSRSYGDLTFNVGFQSIAPCGLKGTGNEIGSSCPALGSENNSKHAEVYVTKSDGTTPINHHFYVMAIL